VVNGRLPGEGMKRETKLIIFDLYDTAGMYSHDHQGASMLDIFVALRVLTNKILGFLTLCTLQIPPSQFGLMAVPVLSENNEKGGGMRKKEKYESLMKMENKRVKTRKWRKTDRKGA
jgi:hypothetical protein